MALVLPLVMPVGRPDMLMTRCRRLLRIGVARQRVGVEAALVERAVERDVEDVGVAVAGEAVDPLGARDIAAGDADQEARVEAIIDAEGGAAERVGQARRIGVAQHVAGAADGAEPGAERAAPSPSQATSQASASATLLAPPRPAPRSTAIWRPTAFMNSWLPRTFIVPKSA